MNAHTLHDTRSTRGLRAALVAAAWLASGTASAAIDPNLLAVQPEQLPDYWVMTNTSLNVDVPNSGVGMSRPTCAAVTYMVGADGVTRDIVVRNTIPAGDLKTVAASAVKDMRYIPGAKNAARRPVYTYLIVPFNLPADAAARRRITDACLLQGFPAGYR